MDEELRVLISHLRTDELAGRAVYRSGPTSRLRRAGRRRRRRIRRWPARRAGEAGRPARPRGPWLLLQADKDWEPPPPEKRRRDAGPAAVPVRQGPLESCRRRRADRRGSAQGCRERKAQHGADQVQPLRQDAPRVDDLPAAGTWDRSMYGFAAALRAERVPAEGMSRLLTDASPEKIAVAKSTVIDWNKRASDASRPY